VAKIILNNEESPRPYRGDQIAVDEAGEKGWLVVLSGGGVNLGGKMKGPTEKW